MCRTEVILLEICMMKCLRWQSFQEVVKPSLFFRHILGPTVTSKRKSMVSCCSVKLLGVSLFTSSLNLKDKAACWLWRTWEFICQCYWCILWYLFLVVKEMFLLELHKKVKSRVPAPESIVLTEDAMIMTLAVGEVDFPAGCLLCSSMLFHALHVLLLVNQSWRAATLFTSASRGKEILTTPSSHPHSLNFHKLVLLTSCPSYPFQIIPTADISLLWFDDYILCNIIIL